MKIPSKLEDPENFEENVRDLMTMSYKSWCIRQNSFAEDYLSKGAFWLYYVKDKSDNKYAELAIRLAGDSIQEIRGATQNQEIPEGYEGIIIDFLEKAKDIKGGEEYLKKYYRKRHDAEYKSYIKEHANELLKFYKKYMPYKYIADHDGEEDGSSKLYNWWRGDITKPLETNPNQLTLGFDIKEDTDFEEKDDKFKKNALVYGLIHNADLPNESKSLGYNYYIVEDDITLEDIGKKVDDELINAVVYSHDNGVEVEVYGIDYSMFITDIKAQDPKEFNQIEAMIDWCPDFDSTGEFFEQASGHLDDHAFYYGQRHGEEEVYLNALHNRLKTNISDCMEHFSVEAEGGYYADSDDISITIDHDGLINILLDEFEDISYQGELSWGEDWESMSSNVNYDGVDTYMALDAFWQEFNTDEYVEYAIEKFSEALLDPEVTHHLSILDSNDISYSGEDGIIYDGKLFAPVIKTEFDEFIKFIPLEQSIELTSEHLDLIFPYLDNQTLFYIYTDKEHGFFGFVESVESVDNPVVQGQS